jgi:hypothetical protein
MNHSYTKLFRVEWPLYRSNSWIHLRLPLLTSNFALQARMGPSARSAAKSAATAAIWNCPNRPKEGRFPIRDSRCHIQ